MLNSKQERELAYLIKVDGVYELPGYDRVESAAIGGWRCVVPKGQFHEGSIGIYFEIDSLVDSANPTFAFMEKRKYRVKTQKMCKSLSQGLLMAPEDFNWKVEDGKVIDSDGNIHSFEDDSRFLTKELKITYYEAEDNIRKAPSVDKYKKMASRHPKLFRKAPIRWLMRRDWGKKLLFLFLGKARDKKNGWPVWVKKTDEERIENCLWNLENKNPWIATEKLDGSSTTFTIKRNKFGKPDFLVCSRNVIFDKPDKKCFYDTNIYLEMANKYNVEEVLTKLLDVFPNAEWITLQGETYGSHVQKRDYSFAEGERRFAGFNFITSEEGRFNSVRAAKLMSEYDIPWVPILDENYILPDTVEELRAFSHSEGSKIDGIIKEGIVFRSQDGSMSFKCVDPEFLMKYHA